MLRAPFIPSHFELDKQRVAPARKCLELASLNDGNPWAHNDALLELGGSHMKPTIAEMDQDNVSAQSMWVLDCVRERKTTHLSYATYSLLLPPHLMPVAWTRSAHRRRTSPSPPNQTLVAQIIQARARFRRHNTRTGSADLDARRRERGMGGRAPSWICFTVLLESGQLTCWPSLWGCRPRPARTAPSARTRCPLTLTQTNIIQITPTYPLLVLPSGHQATQDKWYVRTRTHEYTYMYSCVRVHWF